MLSPADSPGRSTRLLGALCAWVLACAPMPPVAAEPVVTVLADFEDETVAASISDVQGVPLADCTARLRPIPARGRNCLALEIGATMPNRWRVRRVVPDSGSRAPPAHATAPIRWWRRSTPSGPVVVWWP